MKKFNWPLIISALILASALIFISQNAIKHHPEILNSTSFSNETSSTPAETPSQTSTVPSEFSGLLELPVLGNPEAKVLMEVYSDYQCPFSSRYYFDDIKKLIPEYVKTGKVRLVYRDFVFEGDRSLWAAAASHCANEQGKFWEYHEKILTEKTNQGTNEVYEKANLKKMAAEIGLDTEVFGQCLDSGKYEKWLLDLTQKAQAEGINGTPTTKLNDIVITNEQGEALGAMPYEMLKERIEKALKDQPIN